MTTTTNFTATDAAQIVYQLNRAGQYANKIVLTVSADLGITIAGAVSPSIAAGRAVLIVTNANGRRDVFEVADGMQADTAKAA